MVNFSLIDEAWGGNKKIETFSNISSVNFENNTDTECSEVNTLTDIPKKYLKKKYYKNIYNKCKEYQKEVAKLKNQLKSLPLGEYIYQNFDTDKRQLLILIIIGICILIFMNLLKNLFK